MRRFAAAAALLLLATGTPHAAPPKSLAQRTALVKAGRAPAFYDPKNLGREPVISATGAVLMDYETGEVLWSRNPDARRYPASTTKILTALLFVENVAPDETVVCNDARIGDVGESSLHIKPGECFPAEDLLRGFLLRSGNDAGVVIAQRVAGSVKRFADRMNARAAELGATHSHFVNPHGLHHPQHYTTARDLAILARAALDNPRFAQAVRNPVATIRRSISQDRRVVAKSKRLFYDKVRGADGVKTGYTRPAGHCFVGSATRDGRRLIAVVMNAKASACSDTIPILEWGFRRFSPQTVVAKGQETGLVPVRGGSRDRIPTIASSPVHLMRDRLGAPPQAQIDVVPLGAHAPVRAGDPVGRLVVRHHGKVVAETPVLARDPVQVRPVSATVGTPLGLALLGTGAGVGLLVRWRHGRRRSAPPTTQGSRRSRGRIAPKGRGVDRRRTR